MDYFSTRSLAFVLQELKRPSSFFVDTFFTMQHLHKTEEVYFEKAKSAPRMMPYIHPLHPADVTELGDYDVHSVRPAYVKDKRVFDPENSAKKILGEKIGGTGTAKRTTHHIASHISDQLDMFKVRKEYMASEALVYGKNIIKGKGFPDLVVDYKRNQELVVASDWTDPKADIMGDLTKWGTKIMTIGKGVVSHVVVSPDIAAAILSNKEIKEQLDLRRGTDLNINISPKVFENGKLGWVGRLGVFNIVTYLGEYQNSNGETEFYLPANTLLMISKPQLYGVRHYGAIKHRKVLHHAMEYFANSWEDEEQGVQYMQLQSAPLMVPHRIDACLVATIKTPASPVVKNNSNLLDENLPKRGSKKGRKPPKPEENIDKSPDTKDEAKTDG